MLIRDKEYCCWTELGAVTIFRSIHLTSCFAGVGFLGWATILVMVDSLVCSCIQVSVLIFFFLVSQNQESKCPLSGWASCALSSSSVSLREQSVPRCGSIHKLCTPAPYCPCVLFLLAV